MMGAKKYTKADIVDSLYEKTGMSRKEIRVIVDLFTDEIKEALARNVVIELRGFGTFEIKIRKGRSKARNPKTGETLEITSHGIAAFRPGRELKQAVWNIRQTGDSSGQIGDAAGHGEGVVMAPPLPEPGYEGLPGTGEPYEQPDPAQDVPWQKQ
jgi:integration host factor subunit beta